MNKFTKLLAKVCIFLLVTGFSFLTFLVIWAQFGIADSDSFLSTVQMLSSFIAPPLIGLLVVRKVFKGDAECSEDLIQDVDINSLLEEDDSTLSVIKEELACWNWQLIVGGMIFFCGCCYLFSSFLLAILLIVLGIGIFSIGSAKYKEKQELQELAFRRKILNAAAKSAPPAEKPEPPQKLPTRKDISSASLKYKTHKVAGVTHYIENIEALGIENADYTKSKREIIDEGLTDERIWKYLFFPEKVELIPEPDNPADPNAIKVIVDGEHVGYIKQGSCSHVRKLLEEDAIEDIDCTIGGGPYKIVCEEYDDERGKDVYAIEKGETHFFVHLQILEK